MAMSILAVALAVLGQAAKGEDAAWQPYTMQSGQFTVLLPGEPTEQSQAMPNSPGKMQIVSAKQGDVIYIAIQLPNPQRVADSQAKEFFDGVKSTAVKGKLISDRRLVAAGRPAIELVAEGSGPDGRTTMVNRARYVLAGDVTYNLSIVGPKGKVPEADARRFLDSLKLNGGPAAGATDPAPAGARAATKPAEWQTVAPADGGFSAQMPGAPQFKPMADDDKILGHLPQYQVFTPVGSGIVGILYLDLTDADLDGGADQTLKRVQDDDVKRSEKEKAKLVRERKLTVAGHPAREYEMETDENGGMTMRLRSILVGNRLYQLAALGSKADFPSSQAALFFGSFKTTDEKAGPASSKAKARAKPKTKAKSKLRVNPPVPPNRRPRP